MRRPSLPPPSLAFCVPWLIGFYFAPSTEYYKDRNSNCRHERVLASPRLARLPACVEGRGGGLIFVSGYTFDVYAYAMRICSVGAGGVVREWEVLVLVSP